MLLQHNTQYFRCIPPDTPHSVLHSIPTWQDNVDIGMGKSPPTDLLETTYPRLFLHPFVRSVTNIVLESFNTEQTCLLFPSSKLAEVFRSYLHLQSPPSFSADAEVKIHPVSEMLNAPPGFDIFAVLFHLDHKKVAMKFWSFSGTGISSRLAEQCLRRRNGQMELTLGLPIESDGHEYASYYSSHSALSSIFEAKERIKTRFAGIGADGIANTRGVKGVSTSDVYLYATGMSSIWHTHQMLKDVLDSPPTGKTFLAAHINVIYLDSYKIIETTASPGYRFFTNDTLDDLKDLLEDSSNSPDTAILGIFTDFPGNPHLRSADLPRLRALADGYHIPLIIDETVGCHLNVSVLPYADVVVASLTKIFSGYSNVLGGTILLNPSSKFYARFKTHLDKNYTDNYYDSDALVMEINSRGLEARVAKTNRNAEALADWLFSRSKAGGIKDSIIEDVFYPKYQLRENYEHCMEVITTDSLLGIGSDSDLQQPFRPGYGSLLSVSFTSLEAAKTFYNSIQCYKGVTLGTVFTLITALLALAFTPDRADWVRNHDMPEVLVRFSVGEEDISRILNSVEAALFAAGKVL